MLGLSNAKQYFSSNINSISIKASIVISSCLSYNVQEVSHSTSNSTIIQQCSKRVCRLSSVFVHISISNHAISFVASDILYRRILFQSGWHDVAPSQLCSTYMTAKS
jgi:hypothetical protein